MLQRVRTRSTSGVLCVGTGIRKRSPYLCGSEIAHDRRLCDAIS